MLAMEIFHRYKFFSKFSDEQLKAIALISTIQTIPKGSLVVKENSVADKLFLLIKGDIDLIYHGGNEVSVIDALVGSIGPGEIFGVSSLIEPFQFISSVRNGTDIEVLAIDALALRALAEIDPKFGYILMRQISSAVLDRLKFTQMELAREKA